jgi:DNA topoisomerase I
MSSSSDDDTPLVAISNGVGSHNHQNGTANARNVNGKRPKASSSDLSEDDRPLVSSSTCPSNYLADYVPTTQAKRVKPATAAPRKKANNSEETSDDEDDAPLAVMTTKVSMPGAHAAAVGARLNKSPRRSAAKSYKEESDDDGMLPPFSSMASQDDEEQTSDSSDDEPLVKQTPKRTPATNGKAKNTMKKRKKSEDTSEADSTDTEIDNKKAKKAKPSPRKRVKKEVKSEDEMDIDEDDGKNKKASRVKKESKPKPAKVKKEEKEEEVFKWWEQEVPDDIEGDGSKKWDSLQHAGVLFPPAYVPAPATVKIMYDGE